MNEPATHPTTAPASAAPPSAAAREGSSLFPVAHTWKVASMVGAVMVLLAMLGVGLSTTSSGAAAAYWIALVPIYGLLCLGIAWTRAKQEGGKAHRAAVVRQLLHWLGIGVALAVDFLVRGTGVETGTAAGLNALLLLALGCYLAGVHLEWIFALVGVLLTLALIVMAKSDQYLWLIFVVGGVAVAAMLGLYWLLGRVHSRPSAAAVPVPGSTVR
jgi:hypothetical protein